MGHQIKVLPIKVKHKWLMVKVSEMNGAVPVLTPVCNLYLNAAHTSQQTDSSSVGCCWLT